MIVDKLCVMVVLSCVVNAKFAVVVYDGERGVKFNE